MGGRLSKAFCHLARPALSPHKWAKWTQPLPHRYAVLLSGLSAPISCRAQPTWLSALCALSEAARAMQAVSALWPLSKATQRALKFT
eukprot:2290959-Alexandrium_andersonii.AAC.2